MKRATKKKREKSQRQKSQRQKSQRRGRSSDMATLEVQAANDDFGRGTQSAQGNEVINHFEGALRRAGESFRRAGEAFAAQLVNAGEAFADPVVMKVLDRPSTTHTFPFSMFAPGSTIEHVDGLDQHRPASEPEPEPEPQPIRAIELE